jgi:hypothetical protein
LPPWGLAGVARFEGLALEKFGGSDFLGPLSGELKLAIDREGYRGIGTVLPPRLEAGSLDVDIDSIYSRGVLSLRRVTLATANRSLRAELDGSVTLLEAGPQLALNGRWESFRWPLKPGPAVVTSPRGTLSLNGLQPYRLDVAARVLAGSLPPADVEVRTVLNPGRLDIVEAKAAILRGTARLRGEVEWKPSERWSINGVAQNIDPSGIRADLPGSLAFRLDARGSGFGKSGITDIDVRDLTGRVRGTAARGQGSVRLSGDTIGPTISASSRRVAAEKFEPRVRCGARRAACCSSSTHEVEASPCKAWKLALSRPRSISTRAADRRPKRW